MRAAVNQRMRVNILRLAMIALVPVIVFVMPVLPLQSEGHELLESVGVLVLIAGVLGRFWSILYLGGQKNGRVVTDGPFSMTRNPLYFFSTMATFGIGLMLGAASFAVLLAIVVGGILWITARREADFLSQKFGADYDAYSRSVPFFFPDPRLFRAAPEAVFRTGPLRRNLFDAFVFLSFIPLVEVLDTVKQWIGATGFQVW